MCVNSASVGAENEGAHCRSLADTTRQNAFLLQDATETQIFRCPPPWTFYPTRSWKMARNMYFTGRVCCVSVQHMLEMLAREYTRTRPLHQLSAYLPNTVQTILCPCSDVGNEPGTGLQSAGWPADSIQHLRSPMRRKIESRKTAPVLQQLNISSAGIW